VVDVAAVKSRLRHDAAIADERSYGALAQLSRDALAAIEYLEGRGPDGDAASRRLKSQASALTPLPTPIDAIRTAITACEASCREVSHKDEIGDCAFSDAAATLAKFAPFVEAAMAIGDDMGEVLSFDRDNVPYLGTDLITEEFATRLSLFCERYRALVAPDSATEAGE